MAEKRSWLKIRDDGLRKILTTPEDTVGLQSGPLHTCVVCARFCEMMRPICSTRRITGSTEVIPRVSACMTMKTDQPRLPRGSYWKHCSSGTPSTMATLNAVSSEGEYLSCSIAM